MTKTPLHQLRRKFFLSFSFVILVVLLVSAFFFFQAIEQIKNDGLKNPPRSPLGIFLSGERPIVGTGAIEGWMTFDYINTMYNLPDTYLKEMLRIEDKKYPKIPIGRYARDIGFSKEDFVGMVERAVGLYEATPPQK